MAEACELGKREDKLGSKSRPELRPRNLLRPFRARAEMGFILPINPRLTTRMQRWDNVTEKKSVSAIFMRPNTVVQIKARNLMREMRKERGN